jgi:hypothetical protein
MWRGVRWYLVGCVVLVTLAGCGRNYFSSGEREPWRREAELACLNSGTVKEGSGVVRVSPIEGPGMCGADFPLKVSALGESSAIGFGDEPIRPPGSIPGASQPRWPITQSPYPALTYSTPAQASAPMSIEAPGGIQGIDQDGALPTPRAYPPQSYPNDPPTQRGAPPAYLRAPPDWQRQSDAPATRPLPPARAEDEYRAYRHSPVQPMAEPQRPLPRLGPERGPPVIAASMPVEVRPVATLACPLVSALDHWIATALQPAARKWFGQPVAEIKQISAYSCRGMNGNPNSHISEHAFGNALDIAAFVLADGHRITVKNGWQGSPEEQGFLRDIQAMACDQFTTVLAPGSNRFHYDHIHVDLMRRGSGRRICQPGAVDGEVVAARARKNPAYAARSFEPPPTRRYDPPPDAGADPFGWRGDIRRDPGVTGSIAARGPVHGNPAADDNDWVEEPGPRPPIEWATDRHKVR